MKKDNVMKKDKNIFNTPVDWYISNRGLEDIPEGFFIDTQAAADSESIPSLTIHNIPPKTSASRLAKTALSNEVHIHHYSAQPSFLETEEFNWRDESGEAEKGIHSLMLDESRLDLVTLKRDIDKGIYKLYPKK